MKAWWQDAQQDADWCAWKARLIQDRGPALAEIRALAESFLSGKTSLPDLRQTFDSKTRSDWDFFGFKGMNGAMYLNMLVKYGPDQQRMAEEIRLVLQAPATEAEARERLGRFVGFIRDIVKGGLPARKFQPARIPFFVSAWWHVQQPEQWPVYYASAQTVLRDELAVVAPESDDLAANYLSFRTGYKEVQAMLGLSVWDFELFCTWVERHQNPEPEIVPPPVSEPVTPAETVAAVVSAGAGEGAAVAEDDVQPTEHTEVQYLLAEIGRRLGCEIWIASNDRSKIFAGKKLGDLSLKEMPNLGIGHEAQKTIQLIDVIWLDTKRQVQAAFEIECTTNIFKGLLRMADLQVCCPNLNFPLFVCLPAVRVGEIVKNLSRPAFQRLELHEKCGYFTIEELKSHREGLLRFATEPSAIKKLARYVDEVRE